MMKTVNIYTNIPIRNVKPPVFGEMKNLQMSEADILKCLNNRAIVTELGPNGQSKPLNFRNYNTVNFSVEEVVETPVVVPEPVVEETSVVEATVDEEPVMEEVMVGEVTEEKTEGDVELSEEEPVEAVNEETVYITADKPTTNSKSNKNKKKGSKR